MDASEQKRNEEIGKYFFDLSKLSFAGLVIGTILELKDAKGIILLIMGFLVTTLSGLLGNFYFKRNLKKDDR